MLLLNKIVSNIRRLINRRSPTKDIGILSFKFLGDTVFTIPAIDYLINKFPDSQITIFCYPENKEIYQLHFTSLKYVCVSKNEWDIENRKINFKIFQGIKLLRKCRLFILADFTGNYKTAIISLFCGAERTIGFGNILLKEFYNEFSVKNEKCHLMDIFLLPVMNVYGNDILTKKEFPVKLSTVKKILINPYAGWKAKEWNIEKYIKLADELSGKYQVEIISKRDNITNDALEQFKYLPVKITLSDTITTLIESIKESNLVVSNDTGTIYIASLIGKPTFTIFGPTNPKFHSPFGKYHKYIQKGIECSPGFDQKMCYTFGGREGCYSFECMNLLSVEVVLQELDIFLGEINSS